MVSMWQAWKSPVAMPATSPAATAALTVTSVPADVDGDGTVAISDVTAVIDNLIGNNRYRSTSDDIINWLIAIASLSI